MIQFNLLPDVKLDYIKARRSKRMVLVISTIVSGTALGILILLFLVVDVYQKQHLKNLQHDINTTSSKLQNTPDLNKILTVQNQLESLPGIETKNPVTSRLFGYIGQTTPSAVSISSYNIDFDAHTVSVQGNAPAIENINQYVDTLKFATYVNQADSKSAATPAFSSVVLTSFGRDAKSASYSINFSFDPAIFDASKQIVLTVPNTITTRSEIDKPSDLFQQSTNPTKQ